MRITKRRLLLSSLLLLGGGAALLGGASRSPLLARTTPTPVALGYGDAPAPATVRYRSVRHRRFRPGAPRPQPASLAIAAELGVNYSEGDWQLSVNDTTSETEYAPYQAVLKVAAGAHVARPSGAEWNFLGAPAGATISVLPQFQVAGLLYLAVSAEDTESGTFAAYDPSAESGGRVSGTAPWVRLRLLGVDGPGKFSLWSSDEFGQTTVWMSSADGISAADSVWTPEGEDIHLNWGFSKPGFYRVVAIASGYLPGRSRPVWSHPVIYRFNVE